MPLTLDDLRSPGANPERKRVGRGHGSGKGKTAGRGTKGQKARSGPGIRRGFEGGQLPIQKRLPYKRGFTNRHRTPWEVVNLDRLAELGVDGPITPEVLYAAGITRGLEFPVKVLGDGELTAPLVVHAHAFSDTAKGAIEAQGGSISELTRTDDWVTAKPRTRRMPLNSEMKKARVGKVGGVSRREALAAAASREA